MIPSVIFPSATTRTYEISGSISESLVLGNFVFDPNTIFPIHDMTKGMLYRILSVSFGANVPEDNYRESFVPVGAIVDPVVRIVQTQAEQSRDLVPKPLPIWSYYHNRDTLTYIVPRSNNITLGIAFAGTFAGASLLVPSLTFNYTVTIQECIDDRFAESYTEGKF